MTTMVEQMVQQIKTLTSEEQRQIRALLDTGTPDLQETALEQERTFARHLLAKGVISNIPARLQEGYRPDDEPERHPPIIVHGEPVSETIIRERR